MDVSKENFRVVEGAKSNSLSCNKNGQTTKCDKCQSPYAIDPAKRKEVPGKVAQKPKFRKRLDPATNKILTLCNKCGLSMSRVRKRPPKKPLPTQEDKNGYLIESEAFACSLAERLNEPDAKRLYCPHFKTEPCGCLQRYLKGKVNEDPSKMDERAVKLLELLKKAKHLRSEKVDPAQSAALQSKGVKKEPSQNNWVRSRHSVVFEEFVLSHRVSLREELHLCERASQRVLMYSNNFLHKELKSMKNQRIQRKTGKFVKGLLKPITELPSASCCSAKCVNQASSHPELLEIWRKLAQRGQKDARRVLAEMLTHEEGTKTNCYKFISLVTGCSMNTISSVNKHVKSESGSKEPPEHGLKRWWRDNPKRTKFNVSDRKKKNEGKQSGWKIGGADSPSLLSATKPDKLLRAKATLSESSTTGDVIALEEPKLPSDSAQIASLEEISKKMVIPDANQNVTAENQYRQIIQIPPPSSSVIPDLMHEKDAAEFTSCDTTVLHTSGDRVINVQSESMPSGHHMQILEVPVSKSSSHTSVITSLSEKSHSQESLGSTSSQVEFPAVGVPVLVPYIVLLPGTVILDQSLS